MSKPKILEMQGTVLYKDETGTTGNITLSDEITNHKRIKINGYVKNPTDDSNHLTNFSQEFYVSGQTNLYNILINIYTGSAFLYLAGENLTISGTTVTRGSNVKEFTVGTNSTTNVNIYIMEIVGYEN